MRGPPDTHCISIPQRNVHMATEALSIVAVVPFLFWLGTRRELPGWARGLAVTWGLGSLAVDGWLLYKNVKIARAADH